MSPLLRDAASGLGVERRTAFSPISGSYFTMQYTNTNTFRRLGVKTRHVRMSRFDLFRYVVRLSEAHIVSNSCTSAIISNGVMGKKQNKSKADMSVFFYLCFVCSFKS